MEWTASLRRAIAYMEKHLLEPIDTDAVAKEAQLPSVSLQQGFKIMTGYSLGEYIRFRRLYLAALDIMAGQNRVIDLALKYGYETPESFSKAFRRFHGISPSQLSGNRNNITTFLPFKIELSVHGGEEMDYTLETMDAFPVIGFECICSMDDSFTRLPCFWSEIRTKYERFMNGTGQPMNEIEQVISDCHIGEFGVCIDDESTEICRYLLGGRYDGRNVPAGLTVYEIPSKQWARFRCAGAMPGAIQAVLLRIFKEWLPGNPNYELTMGGTVEWYSQGDNSQADYQSEIWIPVSSVNKKTV